MPILVYISLNLYKKTSVLGLKTITFDRIKEENEWKS